MRESEAARYVNALCRELELRRDYLQGASVTTLYFGGGTPSRLTPDQIGQVIDCVRTVFGLSNLSELTVECNPDDITSHYVTALRASGVNRTSMGVQTFNDDLLRFLGRRHTAGQAIQAVNTCLDAGIENISIDLMYGLPGQTLQIQQNDLRTATDLQVRHISSYCLSFEENSPLDRMRLDNRISPVDDDTCAAMYDSMCSHLRNAGFEHYEISNFCRPGFHSRHNSSYWDGTPYIGVGAGAHSYNGMSRQWNPNDLDAYMAGIEHGSPVCETEKLTPTDLYNEKLMLSLRTAQGLNLQALTIPDRLSVLQSAESLISQGLLLYENDHLAIPESHSFISDTIISTLFKD